VKVQTKGKRGGIKTSNVRTIPQLEDALRRVNYGYDRKHDQMMLLGKFIAEKLIEIEESLTYRKGPRRHTQPSEWNRFFAVGMKAGKSPQEIGAEWQERKVRKVAS
jgi:hypothetical protein